MNQNTFSSIYPSIEQDLLPPLHPHLNPQNHFITQFVRSSPVSASPLMAIKSLSQSENGLIKILRLIESCVKSYVYFITWIRPSDPKSSKNPANLRTTRILIGLSFISIVQRIKDLIKITQAGFSESQSQQPQSFLTLQESADRLPTSKQLKTALETASHSLDIIINLLDSLTFLNYLGRLKIHSIEKVSRQISNVLNVMINIINYSKSSIEKAELWKIGRDTRTLILETSRTIKSNKRAIQLQLNPTLSPVSSTIRPTKSEFELDEEDLNQPSSLQGQINLDITINRSRKLILKECKKSLDRVFWSRIIFLIDGLVSVYDLLEFHCFSHSVRTLIELISSIYDFRTSYCQALQSYSVDDGASR